MRSEVRVMPCYFMIMPLNGASMRGEAARRAQESASVITIDTMRGGDVIITRCYTRAAMDNTMRRRHNRLDVADAACCYVDGIYAMPCCFAAIAAATAALLIYADGAVIFLLPLLPLATLHAAYATLPPACYAMPSACRRYMRGARVPPLPLCAAISPLRRFIAADAAITPPPPAVREAALIVRFALARAL